jgi:GNAT superfamily N-acetyltransferase
MLIRPATIEDAAAISEFVITISRTHIAPTLSDAGLNHLLSGMTVPAMNERLSQGFQFFTAHDGERMIGVAAIRLPAHLYYLFVTTEYQRTGVGQALWRHIRNWITETSAAPQITVNSSLNAVGAYERMGFRVSGPNEETEDVRYQPMVWESEHK